MLLNNVRRGACKNSTSNLNCVLHDFINDTIKQKDEIQSVINKIDIVSHD